MRILVASLFTTLDGVVEAPEKWQSRHFDDEMGEVVGAAAEKSDAILLGRRTYEEFVAFWPSQGSEVPMADYLNKTPKHVVSTSLESLEWDNSSLVSGDVAEEVATLKDQRGKNIQVFGSPTLVRSLLRDGLLDELGLLVHPLVVGSGKRLFEDLNFGTALELVDSRILGSGVLVLSYTPAGRGGRRQRSIRRLAVAIGRRA
jgi:dihydrofolate reductase